MDDKPGSLALTAANQIDAGAGRRKACGFNIKKEGLFGKTGVDYGIFKGKILCFMPDFHGSCLSDAIIWIYFSIAVVAVQAPGILYKTDKKDMKKTNFLLK